jgi:hypothetical protein
LPYLRFHQFVDIDLRQSAGVKSAYDETMTGALAQLRLLLVLIPLIAVGAVAGLAGHTSATRSVTGVTTGVATRSAIAAHRGMGQVTSADQDTHRTPCDDCLDCVHSTASGCCAAAISAGECDVLRDAPVAARFLAGKTFLPTGIDPEAPLQPPQTFA